MNAMNSWDEIGSRLANLQPLLNRLLVAEGRVGEATRRGNRDAAAAVSVAIVETRVFALVQETVALVQEDNADFLVVARVILNQRSHHVAVLVMVTVVAEVAEFHTRGRSE